ncbi:hypothetical protein KUCAC02_005304, partial [Chaenocephalus aceratus]
SLPNTHRWGKNKPLDISYALNRKTSLATVKDLNSFAERIRPSGDGVLTGLRAELRSHSVRVCPPNLKKAAFKRQT